VRAARRFSVHRAAEFRPLFPLGTQVFALLEIKKNPSAETILLQIAPSGKFFTFPRNSFRK